MENKKILLIEDELFIGDLYTRILTQQGYQVIRATNGDEGITLSTEKPDLILLDIMIPKINGLEVLRRLKENLGTSDIPIVLLTNLGHENIIKEAFRMGASGYLLKMNMNPYELVRYVKDFLENPNYRMNIQQLDLD